MAEWQPIETAPRGETVLGYVPEKYRARIVFMMWRMLEDDDGDGEWFEQPEDWHVIEPTHWMPLPEPPGTP